MGLIDKNKLLEELKKLKQNLSASPIVVIEDVESLVESLEVKEKEVDLEKEIKRFTMSKELYEADSVIKAVAEHFFELGLKAQKGE